MAEVMAHAAGVHDTSTVTHRCSTAHRCDLCYNPGKCVERPSKQRRGRHRSSRVPRHAPEDTDGWISTTPIGSGFVGIMSGTGMDSGPPTPWTASRSRHGSVSGASSARPTGTPSPIRITIAMRMADRRPQPLVARHHARRVCRGQLFLGVSRRGWRDPVRLRDRVPGCRTPRQPRGPQRRPRGVAALVSDYRAPRTVGRASAGGGDPATPVGVARPPPDDHPRLAGLRRGPDRVAQARGGGRGPADGARAGRLAVSLPRCLAPGQPWVGIVEWAVEATTVHRGIRTYEATGFAQFSLDQFTTEQP